MSTPDTPPEAVAAAADAIRHEMRASRDIDPEEMARAALEAAAPVLAEAVAQKITEHAERQRPRLPDRVPTAWHRHFSIAARVAAGAFDTREDQLRMAAEAIKRGDFIACDIPEVPAEPKVTSEPVADDEPWWCDCPDRKGPHVHMPNWGGQGGSVALTALVDLETGMEIPGSRKAGGG